MTLRALGRNAWIGFALALAWTVFSRPGWANAALAFGATVVVPLALALAATPDRSGRHPWAWHAAGEVQLPGAIALLVSLSLPQGALAAALAIPSLACTLLVALFAAVRFLPRGASPIEELSIDAGLAYLAVAGISTVLSRASANPLGFDDLLVLLSAVHFHYAGLAMPVLAGMAGRARPGGAARAAAAGIVAGVPLVAIGIVASPFLEWFGAWLLAASGLVLAFLQLRIAASPGWAPPRALLAGSGLALLLGMPLAALYAISVYLVEPWIGIAPMLPWHGGANAFGFALPALLAWALGSPRSRGRVPGLPFSALRARGFVGPDIFERLGATRPADRPPRGLMDSLDEYARPGFNPSRVHPAIRAFYERTDEHELLVRPSWTPGFRAAARHYRFFARKVGQMDLPLDPETGTERVASRILPLDGAKDGRPGARAWVRTYERDGRAMYAAAYATHRFEGVPYMNIAFPLPGGNLSSILRMEPLDGGGASLGVELTTLPLPGRPGDAGIWFANPIGPIRTPLAERIRVWTPDMPGSPIGSDDGTFPGTTVVARHDMWLFGLRYLTLDYHIRPTRRRGDPPR